MVKSLEDLKQVFSRLLGISEDELPFEFYERDGELVAHQTGYIEQYDRWSKVHEYAQDAGRAEQAEDDRSWYFIFPKQKAEEKPPALPLHLREETAEEHLEKPFEPGYYPEFPVSRILSHPFSFRVNVEEGLDELTMEIHAAGMIIEPLICRPAEKTGYVELCAGERRLHAAKMIGMRTVPVIVKEMDDVEFDRVRFLENLARKDLSDMEIARVLRYMLEKYKEEYPTQEVLAKAFGKTKGWVSQHLRMLDLKKFWTENISKFTRVNFAEIIDKVTERQVREVLSVPLEKRDELALWIAEKYEETGEIPSAREIREFVRPAEAVPEAVSEAPEISEGEEELSEAKPTVRCARCGKLMSEPVHIKGKFYCEPCAAEVLRKPEKEKPVLNKSIVLEALEKTFFPIYPNGVDLEKIREELSDYDTYNLSDLLFELMKDGVLALNDRGRWMTREEYEKQQVVLDRVRGEIYAAEQVLIDKYGFDSKRGVETYKISEIKFLAKKNGPSEEFLNDLRKCVDLHKEFYRNYHRQSAFQPVKDDVATQNINRIDRWLQKVKPIKLPGGPVEMMHRCPICGRGLTRRTYERLKLKYSHFKELWK